MITLAQRVLIIMGLSLPLAGCIIAPPVAHRPYPGAVFVPGHYDRGGYWVRGHWI
ncbi:hypothetical protein [Acidiphilium sp.]|uniref:hypothetical protein n=1 Tax=Acidiphilium sp. TaxID=527 RepID=UPI003D0117D9